MRFANPSRAFAMATANSPQPQLSKTFKVSQEENRSVIRYRCAKVMQVAILMMFSELPGALVMMYVIGPGFPEAFYAVAAFALIGFAIALRMLLTPVRVFVDRGRLHVVRTLLGVDTKTKLALTELTFEISPVSEGARTYQLFARDGKKSAPICNPSKELTRLADIASYYQQALSLENFPLKTPSQNAAAEPHQKAA